MPGDIEIPFSLRLQACPLCGYLLSGSPAEGTCPECGNAYDSSKIVIFGFGRGKHENLLTARGSRLIWNMLNILVPALLFIAYAGYFLVHFRLMALMGTLSVPVIFFFLPRLPDLLRLFQRGGVYHPGRVQVRIGNEGFAQYDDLTQWSPIREFFACYLDIAILLILVLIAVVIRCTSSVSQIISSMSETMWFPAVVILAGMIIPTAILSFKYRRGLVKVRDGSALNLNMAIIRPTPWEKASYFLLEHINGESWRLRIPNDAKQVSRSMDIEITCTPEQSEDLRRYLSSWIRDQTPERKRMPPSAPGSPVEGTT
jgi:hypothetical protein